MQQIHKPRRINTGKEYHLDYCNIRHREDGIVELEINEGINVDAEMAVELIRMADGIIKGPFCMLSNRIHSYSLSFEAMSALAQYENLAALAIVVHSTKSHLLVETQNFFIATMKSKPIKIFMDFDAADTWLRKKLANLNSGTGVAH
jgi:hypothetical protein